MIEVHDLVFEYPAKRALHGVSMTVPPGAIAALVGPNGAGKTTLLRCIAALEAPYAGHITVDGLDVVHRPRAVHRRLGYLPDFFGLYDDLTVRQSLFYAARAHGIGPDSAPEAAQRAAERVQLVRRMDSKAGELSRGLRQRLAIGQAIVHEPRVLLLDEPASGLDPKARRDLSALLRDFQSGGITQIVSSHILSELEDYSSEMIIIDEGKIVSQGTVAGAQGGRVRIRIEVAGGKGEDVAAWLEAKPDAVLVSATADQVIISYPDGADERAALLADLHKAGFPVTGFTAERRRLEDAYFEKVAGGEA
ncbi:MAG: ABC transporter ATP-binding protein [Alphaproteobacteria bacterium]